MTLISLNFTLYRFVCDKVTFSDLFAVDAESRRFPDNSPFYCCWAIVPRQRAVTTVRAAEWSGCTPASYFRSHGNEIVLTLNNATGNIDIEGSGNVITFNVRPYSNSNEPISVVAKGTLDPRPYAGKPSKNYAIKLRDVSGRTIGKLLFALEVREDMKYVMGTPLRMRELSGASVESLNNVQIASGSLTAVEGGTGCYKAQGNNSVIDDKNRGYRSRKEPYPRQEDWPIITEASNSDVLEGMPAHVFNSLRAPNSTSAVNEHASHKYVRLDLWIERIVVKGEVDGQDNPVPFLVGAAYHLKVRFGGGVSTTRHVECGDPNKLVYKDHMTFIEDVCSTDKLRFSLWENSKQVAGFSLRPSKFRVDVGMQKDYAIPFRYYPTRQSALLELSVQRTGEQGIDDLGGLLDSLQGAQGTPYGGLKYLDEQINPRKPGGRGAAGSNELESSAVDVVAAPSLSRCNPNTVDLERHVTQQPDAKNPVAPPARASGMKGNYEGLSRESDPQEKQKGAKNGLSAMPPSSEVRQAPTHKGANTLSKATRPLASGSQSTPIGLISSAKHHSLLRRMTSEETVSATAIRQYPGNEPPLSNKNILRSIETQRSASPLHGSNGSEGDAANRRAAGENGPLNGPVGLQGNEEVSHRLRVPLASSASKRGANEPDERERMADALLQRMNCRPGMSTTLMEEWMEWRHTCLSARTSRSGSENDTYCRDDSIGSAELRSHAASPKPTRLLSEAADLRPFTPVFTCGSEAGGRPPIPQR
uniref:Uncharacterized protein n=1 Tax=Trypanosoma congolense (strain IL3000) TaxID=1068625 RepID=G0UX67_TRYCI|nr:conserved hypothetical protein [Trypanosoma congolense IL3000]